MIRVENSGPKQVVIDWRVLRVSQEQKGPYFKFKVGTKPGGSGYKVNWESIEPNQTGLHKCFQVEPQRKVMKGRSEYQFRFQYESSQETGVFEAVAVASTSIQDSSLQLEDLVVKLQAQSREPKLLMEKNQNKVTLQKQIGKPAQTKVQKLHNLMGCPLETGISVTGPFELMSTQTDSGLKASQDGLVNIDDKCTLQLEMRYVPSAQDISESQLVTCHYSYG